MDLLQSMQNSFAGAGLKTIVVDSPKDAITFDKMLIIFNENGKIRQIQLYSSKEQKFISSF